MKYLILNKDLLENNPLPELINESIQLILTSPPYFNARNYKIHIETKGSAPYRINLIKKKDNTLIIYRKYLNNIQKIILVLNKLLKPGGIIIFVVGDIISNHIHFPLPFHLFNILSKFFNWKETIIWDKTKVINFKSHSSKRALKYLNNPNSFNYFPNFSHEYILIFKKSGKIITDNFKDDSFDKFKFINNYSRSIWEIEPVPPSLLYQHPARFPFEIPHNLIKFYSNIGDAVFDPFAGYGTTLIESLRLGRIGIANDKEKGFCELMEKNVQILKNNLNFFINQLDEHRIIAHVKTLKKKGCSDNELFDFLLKLNFNENLIKKVISSLINT